MILDEFQVQLYEVRLPYMIQLYVAYSLNTVLLFTFVVSGHVTYTCAYTVAEVAVSSLILSVLSNDHVEPTSQMRHGVWFSPACFWTLAQSDAILNHRLPKTP